MMSELDTSQIVSILGSGGAGALILWFTQRFINTNDKKNAQIDEFMHEVHIVKIHVEQIKNSVQRIESLQERNENKREREREEFIQVKAKVDAAWKTIESFKAKEFKNA